MVGLSAADLHQKLSNPEQQLDIANITTNWRCIRIKARVEGLGALVDIPGLLNKVRGSLGESLLAGASDAVRSGQPCTWSPCCAAEVFFAKKPIVDIDFTGNRAEVPKPFVLAAERHRSQDLLIRLTIFGLAGHWAQSVAGAFADALRSRVHWHKLAAGKHFVPAKINVASLAMSEAPVAQALPCPSQCIISFVTPLDTERTDIAENPQRIVEKLLVRIALMAHWYGASLKANETEMSELLCRLELEFGGPVHKSALRLDSGRTGHTGYKDVSMAELHIGGDLASIWPLLLAGQTTHIGRGAIKGLGRYVILPE